MKWITLLIFIILVIGRITLPDPYAFYCYVSIGMMPVVYIAYRLGYIAGSLATADELLALAKGQVKSKPVKNKEV